MNGQAQSVEHIDIAPFVKAYMDGLESWRKPCETLLADDSPARNPGEADLFTWTFEHGIANWQRTGGEAFKRFVEQQIELCGFLGRRWERYLDLPEKCAHCGTPLELGQLQFASLSRMAADYAVESTRLMQPMSKLISRYATAACPSKLGDASAGNRRTSYASA
jgi:hypothetical protein